MPIDVSVVVPVYNTEKYLPECIESLVHQTLRNVEFIFVDDGSTDRSVEIIEQYKKQDDRIQLIKQKNQYAGIARNNGMKVATGKYIIFLDSDDFFELNMLEEAYNCAERNQAEITVFGYYEYDDQTKLAKEVSLYKTNQPVFSPVQLGEWLFGTFLDSPWNKLYLLDFIKRESLFFQPVRKHNDTFFAQLSIALAKRISVLDGKYVYYRINNPNSLQGKRDESWPFILNAYSAIKRTLIEKGKYNGVLRMAYVRQTSSAIEYRAIIDRSIDSQQFYLAIKNRLVPDLFVSPDDFKQSPILSAAYYSDNYMHFLLLLIEKRDEQISKLQKKINEEYVSKKSKDYLIGHAVLVLPRAAWKILRKKERLK